MRRRHPYHRNNQYDQEVRTCNRHLREMKEQQDEVAKYLSEPEDDVD